MEFNHQKLKGKIVERYGTQNAFAAELGVSKQTISKKMRNKSPISPDEIDKWKKLLKINDDEINEYFFSREV